MAKQNRKPKATAAGRTSRQAAQPVVGLRIIGGEFRGRHLCYSGDPRTRPMKDRLREAIFNLIGPSIRGTHALDLFAGTGALGLESLSRGAARATLIEQHRPTAAVISQNVAGLGVQQRAEVVIGNVFVWWQRQRGTGVPATPELGPLPWVVFCSPPYDFYVERAAEMLELIAGLVASAPPGSVFVVEADGRFDFGQLPDPPAWDIRQYPPSVVGLLRKE
jgi:16S rRNA (guanine966-N2)-methyltransferase